MIQNEIISWHLFAVYNPQIIIFRRKNDIQLCMYNAAGPIYSARSRAFNARPMLDVNVTPTSSYVYIVIDSVAIFTNRQ